ncbi:Hypothetical protein D9617_5g068650 [Elsinoe fawcettii]|nr:Hypothetical protein D9617_5g068650 [Elsinoe fawcettii]
MNATMLPDQCRPYTGQVSDFDLGPDITINYVGTKEPNSTHITAWQWSWWLPEGPQMYKGPATRVTTYYPDGSPADALWHLPDLSKMYPDLPDLSSCKGIHMETTPNQLTAARFLTERITMPKTTAGSLTVPAGHEPTATPAPRPTNPLPTPSEVSSPVPSPEQPVGRPGGGGSPASSGPSFPSDRPDSPSSPGNPARPAWTNAAGGNIGGTGHAPNGDSPAAQAPKITSPALILPGRQTLRPGGPASTVSGHIIALDNNGLVHVRPTSTSGSASGPGTVVSLQQIAAAGGIEVDGTRIPAFGTTIVEDASGPQAGSSGSNSISGGGVTSETGGQGSRVGSILSGIGTWVMSGLGASLTKPHNGTGPSTTQSGGQARNSSVISFTGEACIRTSLRAYFATSVIVVGMLLLL